MNNWQPIDTAPKDGTRVILFGPQEIDKNTKGSWSRVVTEPKVYEGYYRAGMWQIGGFGVGLPTCWMPLLPGPPEDA